MADNGKKAMARDMGTVIAIDGVMLLLIAGFLLTGGERVLDCDKELFYIGAGFCIYFAWWVFRNTLICMIACCTKKP